MKIVVFGASGTMGAKVAAHLEAAGADVVCAQRSTGVDAISGQGLADAVRDADAVVDCLNLTTQSAKKAIAFFGSAANNIATAIADSNTRLVCLSICNAADPAVNGKMGYYQGKAAQEAAYRSALGERATIVRTTQWFELAQTMLDQLSLGPIAAAPHMMTAPLAANDGAVVLGETALGTAHQGAGVVNVRGPAELDLVDVARALRRRDGKRGPIAINFGGPALRDGRLIPNPADVVTTTTLEKWLTQ